MTNVYAILLRRLEGNRRFSWSRYGWEDDNKMNLREMRWEDADWNQIARDRSGVVLF
jgi:hypothetical protein